MVFSHGKMSEFVCYIFVTVREAAFGEQYGLNPVGYLLRSMTGKTESGVGVRSKKSIGVTYTW